MPDPTRRTTHIGQLINRVSQQRSHGKAEAAREPPDVDYERRIRELEQRVEYLETLFEGLQDAVHREGSRHQREIEALEAKIRPHELARALGKFSRERGF